VGYALPHDFGAIFAMLRRQLRGAEHVFLSAHCHNDLGLAVANSLAAIQNGAHQVEVTINGVGESAGNCAMEELVMVLETRKADLRVETGFSLSQFYRTSKLVSGLMNFPIAYNKPIVGRNSFSNKAGIHQDGLLKERSTYEIMDPDKLGILRDMIVLGKHSGRHAIKHCLNQKGISLTESGLEQVYHRFKAIADNQKCVSDEELLLCLHNERADYLK